MRSDIDSWINEAVVCRSMGLFAESLAIYEKVLPTLPGESPEIRQTILGRIDLSRVTSR